MIAVALTACSRPKPPVLWAREGIMEPGSPPRLRPARSPDPTLLASRQGALLVHAVRCCGNGNAHVQVQLFPNEWWRDVIRTDTTGMDGITVLRGLPPGNYTGLARRTAFKQQLFRVTLAAGYIDTLELDLGIEGQ